MTDQTDQPPGIFVDAYGLGESIPAQQGEILGRFLDPVRAKALHEAVRAYPYANIDDGEGQYESPVAETLAIAKVFEAWLSGPEEFEAYLAHSEESTP